MRLIFSIISWVLLWTFPAIAGDFAEPEGVVVLTISGEIKETNVGATLQLDSEMLLALDKTIIETSTIWTDGVHVFQGVSLKILADTLGVTSGAFMATAINDYSVRIPIVDATDDGPILAYYMDDEKMSVRDKGPLWVVYPYDNRPEFRTEVIYSRSIWQLDRIDVVQ